MGCGDMNHGYEFNHESAPNPEGSHHSHKEPFPHGPCHPIKGCPEPFETVCIKTDKVFDSCFKSIPLVNQVGIDRGVNFIVVPFGALPASQKQPAPAPSVVEEVVAAWCLPPILVVDPPTYPFTCEIVGPNDVKVSFFFRFRFRYEDQDGNQWTFLSDVEGPVEATARFPSKAIEERGLRPLCEVRLKCTEVIIRNDQQELYVCAGAGLIFNLVANVRLHIPAYGYCVEPDPCVEVLEDCPDFEFPYDKFYPRQPKWEEDGC